MAYGGANGETANQIARALHVDLPPDRFHAAMGTILEDILPAASDSATEVEVADSFWGQEGYEFLDSFRQLIQDRYNADFREADFEHSPEDANNAINDWVRTQTHDMIKKLFDQLTSDTRLVLANALYFKASWEEAFESALTQRTAFHLASGSTMDVSMMHRNASFSYTETNDYQIAELPYEGGRYAMIVLLPKDMDAHLAVNFSAADLQNWIAALRPTDLSLALPKFKLETSLSLVETLQSAGITDAFDENEANFSGINGRRDLYISQAIHKAVVEVDETGTKAAAVIGIVLESLSQCVCSPPAPIPFYADHAFHFLIRDRQTDSMLFLGQVQQPTAYAGDDPVSVELPKAKLTVTTNPVKAFDVNANGNVSPADALAVINYLNYHPSQSSGNQQPTLLSNFKFYADVDGDGHIAPTDVLLIINHLNEPIDQSVATVRLPRHAAIEPIYVNDPDWLNLLAADQVPGSSSSLRNKQFQFVE